MYATPPKDMSPKTSPLLLTQPVETPVVQSVDSELNSGPLPTRLTPDDVSKMFKEVTKIVYGTGQKP
jgi:hypothetical protein